jgi:phosphonate transport system permease protein
MPARAMPESATPARFERPGALRLVLYLLVVLTVVSSLEGAEISLSKFVAGVPRFVDMVARMLSPDGSRLEAILGRLLETFQMALAGTIIGVVLSLPLAILSTWPHTPHAIVYHATRALVALFRTVPDLVWAGSGHSRARSHWWRIPSASAGASSPRPWRKPKMGHRKR